MVEISIPILQDFYASFYLGTKCFLTAEKISAGNQYFTKLRLRLFGQEEVITELSELIETTGVQAIEKIATRFSRFSRVASDAQSDKTRVPEQLKKLTKWEPKCFSTDEAFDLLLDKIFGDRQQSFTDSKGVLEEIEVVTYQCRICLKPFEDIGNVEKQMQLEDCLHCFCHSCWKSYLSTKATEGQPLVHCPEFRCESVVDTVTLLSFLDAEIVTFWLKNKFEHCLTETDDWKWCPGCARPTYCRGYNGLDNKSKIFDIPTLKCACSKIWCFECEGGEHWPATCDAESQYKLIRKKEIGNVFDEHGNFYETSVFVKRCPSCKTPIDKNGGCRYMACRCSRAFCWNCLKPGGNCNPSTCRKVDTKSIIFTSIESLGKSLKNRCIVRAFKFYHLRSQLGKRKVKLGISRQSTSIDKKHPESSRMEIIQNIIMKQSYYCSIAENIAISGLTSKSKHYNARLFRFLDCMELVCNSMSDALKMDHVATINIKEINKISIRTESIIVKFNRTEMHSKVGNSVAL